MANVLVVFLSKFGQASKIAEYVGQEHRRFGHAARVLHVDVAQEMDLRSFDAFMIVAPVYFGRHPRALARFVRHASAQLAAHPSALVSVSNSAASADPAIRAKALHTAKAFASELAWTPRVTITAGGALAYPRYGWILRFVMKRIARANGSPTDTSSTHELTSWQALDADLLPFFTLLHDGEERRPQDLGRVTPAAA